MKGRFIQVFSDDCKQCIDHINNIEIGKCAGCRLEVISINRPNSSDNSKIEKYHIVKHPTTIIDEEIKVEGEPDFYWQCGDEFYRILKTKFPFKY